MPMGGKDDKPRSPFEKILRSTVAGGLTGMCEITISYPTEYIKTMQQLYPEYQVSGTMGCIKDTLNKYGFFGHYRGLSCLLFFTIPKVAVRFGSKEIYDSTIFTTPSPWSTF